MRLFRLLLLLPLLIGLAACNSQPILEAQPFKLKEGHCVVLVGVKGTETVMLFNAGTMGTAYHLRPTGSYGVFAFEYPLGTTLRMTRVAATPGVLSGSNVKFREANLPSAHELTPKEPGIYYYGTILSEGDQLVLTSTVLPDILKMARAKYANIFQSAPPRNFK